MIAKTQLTKFYAATAQSYSRESKDGELQSWLDVLGGYQPADLDAALRRWHSDITLDDFTGRPAGSKMPTPAELKLSIERFEAKGTFMACNACEDGWTQVFIGKTVGSVIRPEGSAVDPKVGAFKRCQCWWNYLARRFGVSLAELPERLRENARQRNKRVRA